MMAAIIFGMVIYALSWFMTCELIHLVMLYFGLPFCWSFATLIWMGIVLIYQFGSCVKDLIRYYRKDKKDE